MLVNRSDRGWTAAFTVGSLLLIAMLVVDYTVHDLKMRELHQAVVTDFDELVPGMCYGMEIESGKFQVVCIHQSRNCPDPKSDDYGVVKPSECRLERPECIESAKVTEFGALQYPQWVVVGESYEISGSRHTLDLDDQDYCVFTPHKWPEPSDEWEWQDVIEDTGDSPDAQ